MARPQKHNWEEIKNYYKAGMSQSEICKKFNIPKGRLSTVVKEQKWIVSEHITERVNKVISAVEAVSELPVEEQRAVTEIVEDKLKHRKLFTNSALSNQAITNLALKAIQHSITAEKDPNTRATKAMLMLPALESHGKITERNKGIVLGRDAENSTNVTVNTAVQQNVTVKNLSDDELAEQAARYGIELKR